MMRLDSIAPVWLSHGWVALLAFTASLLIVALLRRPFRRLFGAERSFQLWLLPPLAILASQLPHAANATNASWSMMIGTIATVGGVISAQVDHPSAMEWHTDIVLVWLIGMVISLGLAARAQRRYGASLRGAIALHEMPSRYPIWHAPRRDVGPALVGAWRARIVLPSDFFNRYDATERALILAHETAHARRGDGWWCLLARSVVAGFWFHPLAWLAFAALRQDQELACDALVLREHRGQRHSYASAMLKTQSAAMALPIGCLWLPRHPITERIAMLKLSAPSRNRRLFGAIAVCVSVTGFASAIHAMSQVTSNAQSEVASEYQLDVYAQRSAQNAGSTQIERVTLAVCSVNGKPMAISANDWNIEAMITPEAAGRLRIDLSVLSHGHKLLAKSELRGSLGQAIHADLKSTKETAQYAFVVTPLAGCPARDAEKPTAARERLGGRTQA